MNRLPARWLMGMGVVIISFSAIFIRLAAASPVTITFFRALYALPLLLLLRAWLAGRPTANWRLRMRAWGAGLVLALDFTTWHIAIELIGAGLATVVTSVHVITTMVAGLLILGQRPTRLAVLATPVVLLGVVLISGSIGGGQYGENPALGVVFATLTALCYTAFILLLRSAEMGGMSPVAALFDATLGAAVGALLLVNFDSGFSLVPDWPSHAWIFVLATGSQVIGWLLITYALLQVEPWESSLWLVLQPPGTLIWAYILFQEAFSVGQWIGMSLVLVGVGVVAISRASHRQTLPDPPYKTGKIRI